MLFDWATRDNKIKMTGGVTDFENGCRICFAPVNESPPISLASAIIVNELTVTISSALQEIFPFFIEITKRDDCLPKNICLECLNNLKTSYRFRKICEVNNKKILEILSEHDNLEKGNIHQSEHYKYSIVKCRYLKDLFIKNEGIQHISDCSSIEKNNEETDYNEDMLEMIKENDIGIDLKNEAIQEEDIFGKESIEQKSVIDNKFKCQNCPKSFRLLSEFSYHEKSHKRKYKCDVCTKIFPTEHNLDWHKRRHTSDSNFSHLCPECGKKFLTSTELVRHRRTHVNIKLYQCNICLKKFSQCYSLKLHKMRHVGYRPNVCDTCDKRFTTLSNLNEHKLTHMTEKPHKCKLCAKTWITSSDLKKHMRTHSGEKPYNCQYCERSFARKETRKVHERRHTGEKPYSCKVCHKQFVHLSSLDRHVTVTSHCDVPKDDLSSNT